MLTIPILFVIGQFDIVKRQHIESISKIMPVAKVMILRGHGHFVTYTNPRKFAQLITPFLLGESMKGINHVLSKLIILVITLVLITQLFIMTREITWHAILSTMNDIAWWQMVLLL